MPAIVLVGQRRGSAEAASETLGWPYFLINHLAIPRAPLPLERGRLQCPLHIDQVELAFASIQAHLPEAVFAIPLTEGAVALAAALQDRLSGTGQQHQIFAERLTHKRKMKEQAFKKAIPCAQFMTAQEEIPRHWAYPCVVKTEVGSGSRGIVFAQDKPQLVDALKPGYMAESLIVGKEFSVESFITQGKIIFTNITDYTQPAWENVLPAGFPEQKKAQILAFNASVISAFGVTSGMTHLEIFDTADGLVFGEMARRPPGGYIMNLLSMVYGIDPWVSYLKSSVSEAFTLPQESQGYAGVRMMHPGAGHLTHVSGVEAAAEISGAQAVNITKKMPVEVRERQGVGESCGHCFATGSNPEAVQETLRLMTHAVHWHFS